MCGYKVGNEWMGKDGAGFESLGYHVGEFVLYHVADRTEPAETFQ